MGSGGAQANKFYEEVSKNKLLWFAESEHGHALELEAPNINVTFPLWSTESRIIRLKKLNPGLLQEYYPRKITWNQFKEVLVPFLNEKERVVGVNLSGKNLSGFDLSVEMLVFQVEAFF